MLHLSCENKKRHTHTDPVADKDTLTGMRSGEVRTLECREVKVKEELEG